MWFCHQCAGHFSAPFDTPADQVRCTGCGEAFVEFMPHVLPPRHSEEYDEEEDEAYYDDEEEYEEEEPSDMDELNTETLNEILYNYHLFGDASQRALVAPLFSADGAPPPPPLGASDATMEALPSVNLTAEHVASEPEVRLPSGPLFVRRVVRHTR